MLFRSYDDELSELLGGGESESTTAVNDSSRELIQDGPTAFVKDGISEDKPGDVSSSVVRRMLAMDVAYTPNIALDGGRNDVSDSRVEHSNDDDAINLMAVACACRDVLAYT